MGQTCDVSADCMDGLSCIIFDDGDGTGPRRVCMLDCDPAATRRCEGGEVCFSLMTADVPGGACFPGGTTGVGGSCTSAFECEVGSVCVTLPGEQTCYVACRVGDATGCAAGQTCTALVVDGMPTADGYCALMP